MRDEDKDLRWWLKEGERLADTVMTRARQISADNQWRRQDDEHHLRLFSVQEWRGVYGMDRRKVNYVAQPGLGQANRKRLSTNVVRSCTNAATSMILRSRPYVTFQTDGADFRTLKKSRQRERFVQAHFVRGNIHAVSQHRVRNGNLFGLGGTKVIVRHARIVYENILPGEILVDDQEGTDGKPTNVYQCKLVPKASLLSWYPKFRGAIEKAGSTGGPWRRSNEAYVLVVFAWHFPQEADKGDGWEVMCIDGATLYRRPYRWDGFPGTFYRWEEEPLGFYGSGIPAELTGIQYEINVLLRMIQENTYMGGNLKAWVQKGAKVQMAHISNGPRIPIIEYAGARPEITANDVASPQIFAHLDRLVQTAYNITGISQLDAQSQTPFASMSGRARLVHQNAESLRFKHTVERYEDGFVELAKRTLEAATDLATGYGGTEPEVDETVIFRGKAHLEQIAYSDVAIEEDETDLDIERWSSSQLAHMPGARMEQVDFLVQNGYLSKDRGLVMMDLGNDTRSETDLATAPFNVIDELIERMILDGDPQVPSPYMNLDYALQRVQLEIQRCELREGIPADRVSMLLEFREQTIELIKAAETGEKSMTPPAPPAPAGAPSPDQMMAPAPGAPPMQQAPMMVPQ